MAFWNLAASEPRRAHRFLLNLPLLSLDGTAVNMQYLAKTVTKPAFTISETEHKFLGNTYYYPGAVTWETVSATLVNAVAPDGNKMLYQALYRSGYFDPTDQSAQFGGGGTVHPLGTPNKASALTATGPVIIKEIDGFGQDIGRWILNNPWLTNAKFGDLDYSSEDLLNIELTFRYDWASYVSGIEEGGAMGFSEEVVSALADGLAADAVTRSTEEA